jgi:integrase
MIINPSSDVELPQKDNIVEDGMLRCDREQVFNRLETPITLTPDTATFEEIALHALLRQRLSPSTIEKHLRYARFMEHHIIPVDFRNPQLENFTEHMDYREQIEQATPNALIHEWKAMRMFLKAYGIKIWDYKPPISPKSKKQILPFPEIVREFWHYPYSKNRYETKLYQYLFYFAFNTGIRNPSELAIIQTTDLIFNKNKTAIFTITEPKKHSSQRTIILPYELSCDPRHKSLQNWLNSWRYRVANQYSQNYLFLQPSGKPFTTRHLGLKLSHMGKKVWKYFHPYITRHWNAVAKLIEQKIQTGTFDVYPVKNWLGHEKIETTMNYVKYADQYYQQASFNWLKRVLKHPVEENTLKSTKPQKTFVSDGNPPREQCGPGEIYHPQQKGIFSRNTLFCPVLNLQPISLNLFFFLYNGEFQFKNGNNRIKDGESYASFPTFFHIFTSLKCFEAPLPIITLGVAS